MTNELSLKELFGENVEDIEAIIKQSLATILDQKQGKALGEGINNLMELFLEKKKDTIDLLGKVHAHKQREEYIRALEKCVEERNSIIENIMNELKLTEAALSEAVFQAGRKLKSVHQSEKHRVNSEEIIRFAHQISKAYSVAAPLSWQQGDPSRPYPTEIEFRNSALSNSRVQAPVVTTPALSLLRQQSTGSLGRSTSAATLRGGVSPLPTGPYSNPLQPPSARVWSPSPRALFTNSSPSPRGRQHASSSGTSNRISSPRQTTQPNILVRRPSQSPRLGQSPLTGPSPISTSTTSPAMNIQVSLPSSSKNHLMNTDNGDQIMSSDSSSSSSSDE